MNIFWAPFTQSILILLEGMVSCISILAWFVHRLSECSEFLMLPPVVLLECLLLKKIFDQGLTPWLRNAKYAGASELDKAVVDILGRFAPSPCGADLGNEQLCAPLPCRHPSSGVGRLRTLLTSGRKNVHQFFLQRNPRVWFLAALMQRRPPSARLGPGQYLEAPGSPGPCVAPVCLGGGRGYVEAEEKCIFLSPAVPHVFLAAERAGWIILISHTGVTHLLSKTEDRSRVHSQSLYCHQGSQLFFSPSGPYHPIHHMGEKHHYLETFHQVKHLAQGNLLPLSLA